MRETLIIFLLSWPGLLLAQSIDRQVIAAGGGTTQSDGLILSWTSGEAVAGTLGGALSQGFQRGELLLNPTDVGQLFASLQVKVFPNPTTAMLTLEAYDTSPGESWQVELISGEGRRLGGGIRQWPPGEPRLSLDVRALPAGHYYLRISSRKSRRMAMLPFIKTGVH